MLEVRNRLRNNDSVICPSESEQHNVRVNSVVPSSVNTKLLEVLSDELIKGYSSALPMGRMLKVEDVVQSVLFLLSNQSKMITRITVLVDGGQYSSALSMGRILEVEDLLQSVLFLLGNQSKMITGITVLVDGGHTCYLPV